MKKTITIKSKYELWQEVFIKPTSFYSSRGELTWGRIIQIDITLGRWVIYLLEREGRGYSEDDLCLPSEVIVEFKKIIQNRIDEAEELLRKQPVFIWAELFEKNKAYLEKAFGLDCYNTF